MLGQHTGQARQLLADLRRDPAGIMTRAGFPADPWQAALLRGSDRRVVMLASRQSGKSTVASALALRSALLTPGSLVLLLSPTQRQSSELFQAKVKRLYNALGRPVATTQESQLSMELANGSRIVSLPGTNEAKIRGYSDVAMLIVDEGSRVRDDLYSAVRPMLAVSGGTLVCLSTPNGKRGWFYETWTNSEPWKRVRVTASQCPRIPPAFLEEERRTHSRRWFQQEYEVSFEDAVDQVFASDDVQAALSHDVTPLVLR